MSTVQSPSAAPVQTMLPPEGGAPIRPAMIPVPSSRSDPAPGPTYEGLRLYQLSVDQYHRMAEFGIIDADERIFLIDGILVRKMTKLPPHILATDSLSLWLARNTPEGWHPSNQNPLVLADDGEPEPDLKVVRGAPIDYAHRVATPADTAIVVEVAESSVAKDQKLMLARYPAAGIPEYWIVNLVARRVEVYTDPTGPDPSPTYRHRTDYGPDDFVPYRLEGREVARLQVSTLLLPA